MAELKGTTNSRAVMIWLMAGVGMIIFQVLLGGITRLTGSGLSITEWKPVLGAFPPLNEQEWQRAFDQYKQIGQYKHLNSDYTLSDFKFIYFWEWLHRLWARLIGVVFLVPFIYFLLKKWFRQEMVYPLIILFLLGGLQGAVGWIMVKSGLNDENIYVSHIRLAIHFVAALILLCYTFWFALQLAFPKIIRLHDPALKKFTGWLLGLLTLQLIYGALMAGLKAATSAPTWPTMNGQWWPIGMGSQKGWRDLTDNPVTVQFIHRGLAYLLVILVLTWTWKARRFNQTAWFKKTRLVPAVLILVQALLGIFTVLFSPYPKIFLWLGVGHQFTGMLLLLSLVWMYYLFEANKTAV